MTPWKRKLG